MPNRADRSHHPHNSEVLLQIHRHPHRHDHRWASPCRPLQPKRIIRFHHWYNLTSPSRRRACGQVRSPPICNKPNRPTPPRFNALTAALRCDMALVVTG
ncbi:hypothetical protein EX30DRAFT_189930 [Ascodesmis nigricans]|uniref:Uncharacterized protein n=1 Tax=Ascodesmis nigricans TaxID=341454 RepID=A0A4S2N0K6_9PEZI|nr:hypothetical protein EX30DRAFT_189930 [Ascodesmis nigricans]